MWWCGVDGLIQVIATQFKPDTERLADFVRAVQTNVRRSSLIT
jgi:hypothetical protein